MSRYKKDSGWCGAYTQILKLHSRGITQDEIGRRVHLSRQRVNTVINSPEFAEKMVYYERTAHEKATAIFQQSAEDAANRIVQLSNSSSSDKVKLDAAREILYQVGCKPREVIETIKREYAPGEVHAAMLTLAEMEGVATRLSEQESKFIVSRTERSSKIRELSDKSGGNGEPAAIDTSAAA